MAIDNVNQSGASAAADSAKEDAANGDQSIGPDSTVEEAKPANETATEETPVAETTSSNASAEQETETTSASATPKSNSAEQETETTSVSATANNNLPTEPQTEIKAASETTSSNASAEQETEAGGDFSSMLENYEKESAASKQEGEIIRGIVVGISEQNVLIDIGYKSEGVVPREEFLDRQGNLTVKRGDEVDVLLKSLENQDGYAVLSRADAVRVQAWDKLRIASQTQQTITGRVIKRIKGGLEVDVDGVEAFLPGSQVDVRPVRNLEIFINQEIEVRVIKINRKRGNVVVSRKALLEEEFNKKKSETLGAIEEGFVLEGTVKSITDYGAFIDLGGIDGLLHIIDMSWGRIQSPNEIFKVGDQIQVKVLKNTVTRCGDAPQTCASKLLLTRKDSLKT